MARPPNIALELSVERIANGYLVSREGHQPVYCVDEEAVLEEVSSKARAYCRRTEMKERGAAK